MGKWPCLLWISRSLNSIVVANALAGIRRRPASSQDSSEDKTSRVVGRRKRRFHALVIECSYLRITWWICWVLQLAWRLGEGARHELCTFSVSMKANRVFLSVCSATLMMSSGKVKMLGLYIVAVKFWCNSTRKTRGRVLGRVRGCVRASCPWVRPELGKTP